MIASLIGLVVASILTLLGFDVAAVPAGLAFAIGIAVTLAVYRHRYGRL